MFFSDLKCGSLSRAGFSVDIETKTPISKETILKGLGSIQRLLPELTQSDTSEDGSSFLLSTSKPGGEAFGLAVDKFNSITFFVGADADVREDILNFELFDQILSEFGLDPVNIGQITQNFLFFSDWAGNHYQLIQETLLQGSPIAQVFSTENILDNDLFIRGLLEEPYRAAISIDSNVSESEILENSYEEDFLRISVHVERPGSTKKGDVLSTLMKEQRSVAERFVRDVVFPKVIVPVDSALVKRK